MKILLSIGLLVFIACNSGIKQEKTLNKKELTCLFFFIPDCPASRACMSPIQELQDKYNSLGLKVKGILSDPHPDDSILNAVLAENKIQFEIIPDTNLALARERGATTTPQFFLLDSLGNLLYSGLIDNYYYSFGKHRATVTKTYLEDAIIAYLSDQAIAVKETEPIGCKINFD